MWHKQWTVYLAAVAISLSGCGGPEETGEQPDGGAGLAAPTVTPGGEAAGRELTGPAAAVWEFLEGVRTGNDEKAASMLTATAHQKTAEMNLVVAPPGSDTATFEVGRVEYVAKDGARVACTWTDLDEKRQPQTDEMLWVLRREPEGWRIAGVAATVFEGEPPLLLNFEDPAEMLRKQQQVREMARQRAQQEGLQAQNPENLENSIRR